MLGLLWVRSDRRPAFTVNPRAQPKSLGPSASQRDPTFHNVGVASNDVGLHRKLLSELVMLRGGVGLTIDKVRQCRALLGLPLFSDVPAEARAQVGYDTLVDWVKSYDHAERRLCLATAFGLQTGETSPDVVRLPRLERRRAALATRLNVKRESLRDREDEASTACRDALIERSLELLQRQLAERTAPHHVGVDGVTLDFYRGVDWTRYFSEANELDIFVTYGRSWRRTLTAELTQFFTRPGVTCRVVMPDLRLPNITALPEIAKRAGQSIETLRKNIADAYGYFSRHGALIWASDTAELFASYRMGDKLVVTLYNHERGQSNGVPTLVMRERTAFFDWFVADFDAVINKPELSRPVSFEEAQMWFAYNGDSEAFEREMETAAQDQGA